MLFFHHDICDLSQKEKTERRDIQRETSEMRWRKCKRREVFESLHQSHSQMKSRIKEAIKHYLVRFIICEKANIGNYFPVALLRRIAGNNNKKRLNEIKNTRKMWGRVRR